MITYLATVPVFVSDQDAALQFYKDKLGLEVVTDMPYGGGARWLTVKPKRGETELLLFAAHSPNAPEGAERRVGGWTGMVFRTDDIWKTYEELRGRGVEFEAEPSQQPWGGMETWFSDPDGNRFHLAQRPEQR
jgi:lactoylglutathione lyase